MDLHASLYAFASVFSSKLILINVVYPGVLIGQKWVKSEHETPGLEILISDISNILFFVIFEGVKTSDKDKIVANFILNKINV